MKPQKIDKKCPPWEYQDKHPGYETKLELPEREWVSVGVPTVTKTGKTKMDNSKPDIVNQVEIVDLETDERYSRMWRLICEAGVDGIMAKQLMVGFHGYRRVQIKRRLINLGSLEFIVSASTLTRTTRVSTYFTPGFAPRKTTLDEQRAEKLLGSLSDAGNNGLSAKQMNSGFRLGEPHSHITQKLIDSGEIVVIKTRDRHGRGRRHTYYHRDFAPQQKETV